MLVPHQNLMNVIRVCRAAGEMVSQNLKDVPESSRIVNIDVGHALIALHEESHGSIGLVSSGRHGIGGGRLRISG
jgi:hypothetical protein